MRRFSIFLVLSLIILSCTDEKDILVYPFDGENPSFFVEDIRPVYRTKTSLFQLADSPPSFSWSESDIVGVVPADAYTSQTNYCVKEISSDPRNATFNGGAWSLKEDVDYIAYYPYQEKVLRSSDMVSFPVSGQVQTGNNSLEKIGDFDYLYSSSRKVVDGRVTFTFKHLMSLARFQIRIPETLVLQSASLMSDYDLIPQKIDVCLSDGALYSRESQSELRVSLSDIEVLKGELFTLWVILPPISWSNETISVRLMTSSGKSLSTKFKMCDFEAGNAYSFTSEDVEIYTPKSPYVDMGLSVMWGQSTCGIHQWGVLGAASSDCVEEMMSGWKSYPLCSYDGSALRLTKYNLSEEYGRVDGLTTLEAVDDIASVRFNDGWRTPTAREWKELVDNCDIEYIVDEDRWNDNIERNMIVRFTSKIPGYVGRFFDILLRKESIWLGHYSIATDYGVRSADSWIFGTSSMGESSLDYQIVRIEVPSCNTSFSSSVRYRPSLFHKVYDPRNLAKSVIVDQKEIDIYLGDEKKIDAVVLPDGIHNKMLIFSIADETVAAVDNNGIITPKHVGSTIVRVEAAGGENVYAECKINVKQHVESVSLNSTGITIGKDDKEQLIAIVLPESASDKTIIWTSSNNDVATVTNTGLISGVGNGAATVTATTVDGSLSAACEVMVIDRIIHVSGITLPRANLSMVEGETIQLEPIITPADATFTNVSWKSSNENIVRVSSEGLLTAMKPGQSEITVTTEDGDKLAKCTVTVSGGFVDLGLSVKWARYNEGSSSDANSGNYYTWDQANRIGKGKIRLPSLQEFSELLSCCKWRWTGSGYEISGNGNTIFLRAAGEISADVSVAKGRSGYYWSSSSTDNKGIYASYLYFSESLTTTRVEFRTDQMTVRMVEDCFEQEVPVVETGGVTINDKSSADVGARIISTGHSPILSSGHVWGIHPHLDIDQDYHSESKSKGSAWDAQYSSTLNDLTPNTVYYVCAYAKNNIGVGYGEVKTFKTGESDITSIGFDISELSMIIGSQYRLNVKSDSGDISGMVVSWSSSNPSVATISEGLIEAVSTGSAIITATVGGLTARCTVTVASPTKPLTSIQLDRNDVSMIVGDQCRLQVSADSGEISGAEIDWSSSNPSVATVSEGLIEAVSTGSAIITATVGGLTARCTVTVTSPEIPLASIKIGKTELSMIEGSEYHLTIESDNNDMSGRIVEWSSSDESVAKVKGGKVVAIRSGSTIITAKVDMLSAECAVTVYSRGCKMYIDEYGINRGGGISLGGVIWAPVNCGYKESTSEGNGYPYGKMYQWGRKYGQGYNTQYDESAPSFEAMWTGQNGEENPDIAYKYGSDSSYPRDWIKDGNPGYWNSGTETTPIKTEHDPCPIGWRVPTGSEMNILKSMTFTYVDGGAWIHQGGDLSSVGETKVFFPAAGCYYATPSIDPSRGSKAFYWTSEHGYSLYFHGQIPLEKMQKQDPSTLMSVRCVAE